MGADDSFLPVVETGQFACEATSNWYLDSAVNF